MANEQALSVQVRTTSAQGESNPRLATCTTMKYPTAVKKIPRRRVAANCGLASPRKTPVKKRISAHRMNTRKANWRPNAASVT